MTNGVFSPGRWWIRKYQAAQLYHDEDLVHYLDWHDRCLTALDSPVPKAIPLLREMEDLQNKAAGNTHPFLDAFKKDRFSLLTTEELQVSPALLSELKTVAQVRLAVTALAVERWRSAHGGRVPELISEITPNFLSAIPSDPFDGRPLRFKQLEKGYVIYSIGEDLTDDGGKTKTANAADSNHYDITFSVER